MKKLNLIVGLIFAASCQFAFADHNADHTKCGAHGMSADTNHDGNISREEHDKKCAERFDMMDTNHDGMISKDEQKANYEKMHDKMREMHKKHQGTEVQPAK